MYFQKIKNLSNKNIYVQHHYFLCKWFKLIDTHKIVTKSTRYLWTLNYQTGHNQPEYQILFHKKSLSQDIIRRTLATSWNECTLRFIDVWLTLLILLWNVGVEGHRENLQAQALAILDNWSRNHIEFCFPNFPFSNLLNPIYLLTYLTYITLKLQKRRGWRIQLK